MFSFFKSLQWEKIYIYTITALYFHISLSLSPLRFQGTPIQKQPSRFITPVAKVAANFLQTYSLKNHLLPSTLRYWRVKTSQFFLFVKLQIYFVNLRKPNVRRHKEIWLSPLNSPSHHITSQMVGGTWCFWGNWSLGKSLKLENPPSNIISYCLCLFMVLEAIHPIVSRPGDGSIL